MSLYDSFNKLSVNFCHDVYDYTLGAPLHTYNFHLEEQQIKVFSFTVVYLSAMVGCSYTIGPSLLYEHLTNTPEAQINNNIKFQGKTMMTCTNGLTPTLDL